MRQWQRKLDFPWEAGTAQTRIADLTLHMHPTVPNGMQIRPLCTGHLSAQYLLLKGEA